MNDRGHRLVASRNVASQTVDVYASFLPGGHPRNEVTVYETSTTGGAMCFTRSVEPGTVSSPFARLTEDRAQELMDSLWSAGLRPTEGKASAGLAAAQENHLNHLTRILDKVLPVALRSPSSEW